MSVAEALHKFEFRWRYEIFRVNLQFLKLLVVNQCDDHIFI